MLKSRICGGGVLSQFRVCRPNIITFTPPSLPRFYSSNTMVVIDIYEPAYSALGAAASSKVRAAAADASTPPSPPAAPAAASFYQRPRFKKNSRTLRARRLLVLLVVLVRHELIGRSEGREAIRAL